MEASCSVKLKFASDRRHLDEMLHAIVADRDLAYEIYDSPKLGPLGLPISTSVRFTAERRTAEELASLVGDAIDQAALADRFER